MVSSGVWGRFVGVVAAAAMLAFPVGAAAGGPRHESATSAAFTVPGSHGYSLNVKSEHGQLTVIASKDRPPVATISAGGNLRRANEGNVAASTYVSFGQPEDPRVINADLGSLGRISVVFVPSGKRHVARLDLSDKTTNCVAPSKIVRQLGTFTGTILFEGENGYTRAALASAKGSVGTSPFRNCSTKVDHRAGAPQRQAPTRQGASLGAHGENTVGSGSVTLDSMFYGVAGDDGVFFGAASSEQLGEQLFVMRTAQATAPRASFVFDRALSFARVTPPAPFTGSARYTSAGERWTGDLGVAFPGLEVPLAGEGFEATLRPVLG